MPRPGSRQKFGTTNRLDEVAATSERATSSAVTPLSAGLLAVDAARRRSDSPATGRTAGRAATGSAAAARGAFGIGAVVRHLRAADTTSIGVGEPKLMTSLTMSAGSNDSRRFCDRCCDLLRRLALGDPLPSQPLAAGGRQLLAQSLLQAPRRGRAAVLERRRASPPPRGRPSTGRRC